MLCGSCGREHRVRFPRNRKDIEAALNVRETLFQNWRPGETPADLWAENIGNGIYPEDLLPT
jgi:hypothetical protein